ncbi:hypothetical protein PSPO01_16313 [Paraphaeosphaeria sporulosa]
MRSYDWKPKLEIQKKFDAIRNKGANSPQSRALKAAEARFRHAQPRTVAFDDGSASAGQGSAGAVLQTNTDSEGCLQAAAVRQPLPSLLQRWILDGGSNVHIANHRNKSWKKIAVGKPTDVIFAGGQKIQIEEWGNVEVLIDAPTGKQLIKLSWVACIPSFFTSIVSLSRCRTIGIEFDSGKDCLYQKASRQVVCELAYEGGHWLLDADGNERPSLETLHFVNAVEKRKQMAKPSYAERPPLEVTRKEAHQMLGHPSVKAVEKLEQAIDGVKLKDGPQAPKWDECVTCIEAKLHKFSSCGGEAKPATMEMFGFSMPSVLAVIIILQRRQGTRAKQSCRDGLNVF